MLTFLPVEEIDKMDAWEGSQLNTAKEILAYELTKLVHGEEEANKAQAQARALFSTNVDADSAPTVELSAADFADGKADILALLVGAELCASRSEARRAVEQGGVTVDGEKVTDFKMAFDVADLAEGKLIKRGKKNFKKVVVK
jgi:tyrosyl-tRNA synthetase